MIPYTKVSDDTSFRNGKKVEFDVPVIIDDEPLETAYIATASGLGAGYNARGIFKKELSGPTDERISDLLIAEGKTEGQALYTLAEKSDNLKPTIEPIT